jgi:HSP20 family molecular chaperone IbpA
MSKEVVKQEEYPKVQPFTDIIHKDDSYYIIMDMPGVTKEKLDISIEKDVLTVEATTEYPSFEGKNILRNEFGNVKYIRQFTLSDAVDREKIGARLKNGVLTLTLPKAEKLQPQKIQIETA